MRKLTVFLIVVLFVVLVSLIVPPEASPKEILLLAQYSCNAQVADLVNWLLGLATVLEKAVCDKLCFSLSYPERSSLFAPVAQLDRAPASGAGCYRFKSCRAYLPA